MKKIIGLVVSLMMVVSLTGCNNSNNTSASVKIGGSTSVEKIILSAIEVFNESNPDIAITYDPTGSSTGVKSVASKDYDIGLASRDVKDSEVEKLNVEGVVFAIDGIVIVTNNQNSVTNLSLEQITSIANGTIKNWSEVGGSDAPIVLIGREAGSGTRDGFENIIGVEDCVYEQELTSTGSVIAAVSQNVNAIGYTSLSAVDNKIKTISVDNVHASEETIKDKTYKIQRNFNFVISKENNMSEQAKAFYDFVLSKEAIDIIKNAGAIPTK